MERNTPGEIRAAVMQVEEAGGLPIGLLQSLYENNTGYRYEQNALPKHRQNGQNKEDEIVDAGLRLQEKMGEFGNNQVLSTHAFMYGDKRTTDALQNGFSQDEIDNTIGVLARVGKYGGEPLSNEGLLALSQNIGLPSRDINTVANVPPPKPVVPKKSTQNPVYKTLNSSMGESGSTPSHQNKATFNLPEIMSAQLTQSNGRYSTDNPLLDGIMYIESRGNTNAVSPTGAAGLFQFTRGTGRQYGLVGKGFDYRKDPAKNLEAMKRLVADNAKALQKNGIPITPANIYMAHQQGIGGTIAIYKAAASGTNVPANIRKNMDVNGGKGLTPAQFIQKWNTKADKAVAQAGGSIMGQNSIYAQNSQVPQGEYTPMPLTTQQQSTDNEVADAINNQDYIEINAPDLTEIAKEAFSTKRKSYVPKYVSQAVKGAIKSV